MKTALASLAALSLAAASPAVAGTAAPDGQPATSSSSQAAPGKEQRKTCRRYEASANRTGATRLCLTKEEWKKFDAEQTQD